MKIFILNDKTYRKQERNQNFSETALTAQYPNDTNAASFINAQNTHCLYQTYVCTLFSCVFKISTTSHTTHTK